MNDADTALAVLTTAGPDVPDLGPIAHSDYGRADLDREASYLLTLSHIDGCTHSAARYVYLRADGKNPWNLRVGASIGKTGFVRLEVGRRCRQCNRQDVATSML